MQGVENSELVHAPARETTLLHHGARKVDGGSENPTADGQHDIKLQEAAITAQPGDASGSEVRSWALDGDRHDLAMVVLRGETGETPTGNPILQRGLADLVVIPRQGGVCEVHFRLCSEHCQPFVHPRVQISNLGKLPSSPHQFLMLRGCDKEGNHGQDPDFATLCLQTGLERTSTSSLLQALVCEVRV